VTFGELPWETFVEDPEENTAADHGLKLRIIHESFNRNGLRRVPSQPPIVAILSLAMFLLRRQCIIAMASINFL